MLSDNARNLLSHPIIARVTTIGPDGYPHTVPVWYLLDGEDLLLFTDRNAQKTRNARANSKGSIAVGGDPVGSTGYLIEGDFSVEDDVNQVVTAKITNHYEPPDKAKEWMDSWREVPHVVLRLKPRRVIKVA